VVDSDQKAEEHPSREEIVARHEPIHTYPRPRRKPLARLMVPALVCGFLFGFVLPVVWVGIVWALLGWLLPSGQLTYLVIFLIPPVAGLVWAMLREPEHELYAATKAFLWGMLIGWSVFVLCVLAFLVA
jgi:hypothetical protein